MKLRIFLFVTIIIQLWNGHNQWNGETKTRKTWASSIHHTSLAKKAGLYYTRCIETRIRKLNAQSTWTPAFISGHLCPRRSYESVGKYFITLDIIVIIATCVINLPWCVPRSICEFDAHLYNVHDEIHTIVQEDCEGSADFLFMFSLYKTNCVCTCQ